MEDSLRYDLLRIIKYNSNVIELVDKGYEYGQIILFINKLNDDGYLLFDNYSYRLSEEGILFIDEFEKESQKEKYSKWLLTNEEKWKKPIGKYDYFPWKDFPTRSGS